MKRFLAFPLLLLLAISLFLPLHSTAGADVTDTVREVILRLKEEQPAEKLLAITPPEVASLLTEHEHAALGSGYITFRVNVPVTVSVLLETRLEHDAFWLEERGFTLTDKKASVDNGARQVWQKDFPEGIVGLGVNSLSGDGNHYCAVIAPQRQGAPLTVTEVYPPTHTLAVATKGTPSIINREDKVLTELPEELEGQVLLLGDNARRKEAHIAGFFRVTDYPATEQPDQIVLTMTEDPTTSQTIQWRTSADVARGFVLYQEKGPYERFERTKPIRVKAKTAAIEDLGLLTNAVMHRHRAVLKDLRPDTAYVYSVGDGSRKNWSADGRVHDGPPKTLSPFHSSTWATFRTDSIGGPPSSAAPCWRARTPPSV